MGRETSPEGGPSHSSVGLKGGLTLAQGPYLPRDYRDSQVRLQPNLRGGSGVTR